MSGTRMCSSSTLCPPHRHACLQLSCAAPAQTLTASCSRQRNITCCTESTLSTAPADVDTIRHPSTAEEDQAMLDLGLCRMQGVQGLISALQSMDLSPWQ